jgi:hypothetical protein
MHTSAIVVRSRIYLARARLFINEAGPKTCQGFFHETADELAQPTDLPWSVREMH